MTDRPDSQRWLCSQCADYDYLNDDDLCRSCAPEPVVEWWQVMVRALAGEPRQAERGWRIG